MDNKQLISGSTLTPELYFLISKFLAAGPLQETAKVLVQELEQKRVLPKRTDWLGNEHEQTFRELEQKYKHIGPNHLLEICNRIGPILNRELPPSVFGTNSLLGAGRQSLLRTRDSIYRPRSLLDYCTRLHGVSLPDSVVTRPIHNFQKVLNGREYGGPVRRKLLMPTSFYSKTKLLRRTVGHLSSVYCVLFDRTGRYIITGADDLLIKIWSVVDGRLLATLRGASAEITDIAINLDNTMLAAGSLDRILRVWDMQTTSPIAVLVGHTGMITSVNFCPSPRGDLKYLVTTSTDGSIAFWQYSTPRGQKISFAPKPIQYHEKLRPGQAQMMCTTFSPGGIFLAAGSADHHVRVYLMSEDGPKRILECEAYIDAVDSAQWSHRGLRFISGSKDGTAHIWTFESQLWTSLKLCMTERLPTCPEPEEGKKLKVTMVAWDCSDKYVITAVNDFTIKIWNSKTAKLHCVLRGHKDELYVLESNPKDEHVLLSAGHDGQVFIWDIDKGVAVTHFINDIDGQGHGGVFDAKWSPDGTMIAATDSHGHILIYGLGIGPDKYKLLPSELFFHTDYRPLLRDASHHVVDEQTQIMPHLMPPPLLVDADGNPHPAKYQRYVPGRESCLTDQLIPNLTVGMDGIAEDNPNSSNYSHIDRLIAALANRQGGASVGAAAVPSAGNEVGNHSQLDRMIEALAIRQGQDQAPDSNNRAASSNRVVGNGPSTSANDSFPRRPSDTNSTPHQGVTWGRPAEQQLQQQQQAAPAFPLKYVRRIYVRPMKYAQLLSLKQTVYAAGQFETQEYRREMRRRPIMINTATVAASSQATVGRPRNTRANGAGDTTSNGGRTVRRRQGAQSRPAAYRTRAVRDQEELDAPPPPEEEDEESSASSDDTSFSNVENLEDSSDDSDTESSDYSDWVADTPGPNLEPPKRSKRKPLSRRRTLSDDSSDETTEQATTSVDASKPSKRNKHVVIPPTAPNGEIPELYRPAEWLSEVIPRKAPYYPQMGDEVVYFRQGHQRYLEAVRLKKVYKLTQSSEPWNFRTLREHEVVRVIGMKYEIRPPRLCCLKLAMIDEDGNMLGTSFKIKYHDMPDVLDFLVLRQTFDLAVQRNWNIGDRFRCMIGDGWWMGQIESRRALSADFPDSYFMCFRVRWDNGEYEFMSPWDLEPIDENRLPEEMGGAVSVLPEEIRASLYQPKAEEWHRGDRDGSCRRIVNGLEQVMRLSIAEHFLAPVDLNIYPDYAYLIEYPIDLTTIKSRFENHFYRRITSAQFDVRYLATNAEKYNRSHTSIVKHARIITDLCLRVIREPNDIDVAAVYHQLVDGYHSSESENDNESDAVPSTSTGPSTSAAAARQSLSSTRRSNRIRSDGDWRSDCRQLLDMMWQRPDSAPFREPVDTIDFPDYLEIISTPMDLRTVKEDLLGGNYEDPLNFAKDVRLIFQNSKNYNTNKRSRIYSMTLRLSALFESHIKTVISSWKAALRRANKSKTSGRGSSGSPTKKITAERNRAGPSTRRNQPKVVARQLHSSEDDDDEDDEDRPRTNQRRGVAGAVVRNGLTSGSNRVTSSSTQRRGAVAAGGGDVQATRSSRRKCVNPERAEEGHDDSEEVAEEVHVTDDEEHTSSSSSSSSPSSHEDESSDDGASSDDVTGGDSHDDDDDDDDDLHPGQRRHHRRRSGRSRKKPSGGGDDSEESYKPDNDRRSGRQKFKKRRKSSKRSEKQIKRKRRAANSEDEDGEKATSGSGAGAPASKKRATVVDSNIARGQRRNQPSRRRRLSSEDDEDAAVVVASLSQADETTQDTLGQHTPKKKGRPAKAQSTQHSAEGPSTSGANCLPLQSPSRSTRHQLSTTTAGNRRNAAENDHSYHLPVRNGRIAESDTDSREVAARPTRASVKRAILDWARGSDLEEAEESEEAEEILPTPTPTKVNGGGSNARDLNGPTTSRAALSTSGTIMRQLRTNRNTRVEPLEDSDDDDGSDNEPLASSQGLQQRSQNNSYPPTRSASVKTNAPPHPLHLQRRTPHAVAISASDSVSHMTRSHATSTTSSTPNTTAIATSSAAEAAPLAAHDHNYLGDPGPSTSGSNATLRNTRRGLSRHQCNADELDIIGDPLDNTRLLIATARFRRRTSTYTTPSPVASATANSETTAGVIVRRRGRSRYSQENSQSEIAIAEEEDEDDPGASDEGTNGDSSSQHGDDPSDSEDNQPLTSYVPDTRRTRNHHVEPRRTSGRSTQSRHSDDSFVCDDDDDDDYVVDRRRHRGKKAKLSRRGQDDNERSGSQRLKRGSTRNQKRPRYNEQSDEEEYVSSNRKRRLETNGGDVVGSSGAAAPTSSQRTAVGDDREEPGAISTADSDEHLGISVSSRGRVRKITAKARGIFKE